MELKVADIFCNSSTGIIKIKNAAAGKILCDNYLIPMYKEVVKNDDILEIDFSSFNNYVPDFFEEAFGRMVRVLKVDFQTIFHNMIIQNCEDTQLYYLIVTYMHEASKLL